MQIPARWKLLLRVALIGLISQASLTSPTAANQAGNQRSPIGIIKIDEKSALQLSSRPALKERKLSHIYIEIKTDNAELAKKIVPIGFDADMPEHYHGMMVKPTKPELLQNEKNRTYEVRGVKLHMPGNWRITVKLKIGDEEKELTMPYDLKL
ncbi:MAG: hypothetical protein ACOH5I_00780 [Oligoflexus sp.]